MQEMPMIEYLPNGTLEGAIQVANRLGWNVAWHGSGDEWTVWGGEKTLLKTSSRDAAEAFLYALGIAYALLPEDTLDHLVYWVKRWGAPEDITPEERARFGGTARSPEP